MSLQDELMDAGVLTPDMLKLLEANAERGLAEEAEEERKWLERQERLAEREEKKANREQKRAEQEQKQADRASHQKERSDRKEKEFDAIARIDRHTKSRRPLVVEMRNLESRGIRWLWPNRIPLGKLTLFSGDAGLGKSYVAMDIAARVTNGSEWPGEEEEGMERSMEGRKESGKKEGGSGEKMQEESIEHAPLSIGTCADIANAETALPVQAPVLSDEWSNAGVLILSDDDEPEDTLMPRLEALGANADQVRFMNRVECDDQEELVSLPTDIDMLERVIVEMSNCKLVIIDPLASFLSSMSSGSLAKVRAALNPLKNLARRHNVAIILINHLNKSSGNPLHRSAGSVSIMGAARTAWAFARCNHDPARCVMVPLKNNIGPAAEALSYVINNDGLQWDDEPFQLSAADAFGDQEKIRSRNPYAVKEAVAWLAQIFSYNKKKEGIPQTWLETEARIAGISGGTLKRAKKKMGIVAKQFEKIWLWSLPQQPQ